MFFKEFNLPRRTKKLKSFNFLPFYAGRNYESNENTWALIFDSLGIPDVIYLLLMLVIFSMSIPDYTDNIVLFIGIAVLGVNFGRAYMAPEFAKIMSKEKKHRARLMVMAMQWEIYLVFTLMISEIILVAWDNSVKIPLSNATEAMAYLNFWELSFLVSFYIFHL